MGETLFNCRDELTSFLGPGIVVADAAEVWHDLLGRTHHLDLTDNGL